MARLLLVEDDPQIRGPLLRALADLGHAVDWVAEGLPALKQVVDQPPELVVLDLGLPDVDGVELLRMLRGVSQVPVIVATARDDEGEIVRTLDAGADDYVVKPYSAAQLAARIRAVLRRRGAAKEDSDFITVGELTIDLGGRTARLGSHELELSRLEYDLLAHLAANVGQVLSRRVLLAEVWRQPLGGGDRTLDVHVSWLRRKLGESAAEPRYLHTVRGVGFKLVDPTG